MIDQSSTPLPANNENEIINMEQLISQIAYQNNPTNDEIKEQLPWLTTTNKWVKTKAWSRTIDFWPSNHRNQSSYIGLTIFKLQQRLVKVEMILVDMKNLATSSSKCMHTIKCQCKSIPAKIVNNTHVTNFTHVFLIHTLYRQIRFTSNWQINWTHEMSGYMSKKTTIMINLVLEI